MTSELTRYSPGDVPSAAHLNELSRLAELKDQPRTTSHKSGNQHGGTSGPPAVIRVANIVDEDQYDDGLTIDTDLQTIEFQYYDEVFSEWTNDTDGGQWPFDPSPELAVYYDAQRGAFIPLASGGSHHIAFDITAVDCALGTMSTDADSILRYNACAAPPGADNYGVYTINDVMGLMAGYTEAELLAARGYAVRWNVYPGCTPRWDVLLLTWTGGC